MAQPAGDYTNAAFAIQQTGGNTLVTTTTTRGNPAAPVFETLSGPGTLSQSAVPGTLTLDLGKILVNGPSATETIGVLNGAAAPTDLLGGSFSVIGSVAVQQFRVGAIPTRIRRVLRTARRTITLNSSQLGTFTETITLAPTDSAPGGGTTPLGAQTLVVTGTVVDRLPGAGRTARGGDAAHHHQSAARR